MTSARLVALAVLFSSALVCAQQKQGSSSLPEKPDMSSRSAEFAAHPEPWNIFSDLTAKAHTPQDPLARLQNTRPPVFKAEKQFLTADNLPAGSYCLNIRRYQVARDSKDSDSTHLVGYLTCLPASRYRLRTAVETEKPVPTR